jgi:hypothetical protein
MKKLLWCPQHQPTEEQIKELSEFKIDVIRDINPEMFQSLSNTPKGDLRGLAYSLKRMFAVYQTKFFN